MDKELIKNSGLTQEEFEFLKRKLHKEPSRIEVIIAGAMWSEHCSYKSSKPYLNRFPTKGKCVLIGPGENAGVVDLGDGDVAAFKMESHNHPSFIEPYQGAATGVGGILRDIFTMGARPVFNLDALFFGDTNIPRNKYIIDGVVRGIGDYGNCVGVPTIGGQTFFDKCFNSNNLVNAFSLGIGKKEKIFLGIAKGIGNPIFYVGSKTGRDGIHGAIMASSAFSNDYEKDRPAVQVGDPFIEKLLIEACLEVMDKSLIEGIQDMGAAGLTSSAFEMAHRGGVGLKIFLDRLPTRQPLTPEELLLSESQERMLIVAKSGCEKELEDIFKKWSLDAEIIGYVTESKTIKLYWENKCLADVNVDFIVSAPFCERSKKKPQYVNELQSFNLETLKEPGDYNDVLLQLLMSPEISDKTSLYEQYDLTVQTNTLLTIPNDASLIRLKNSNKGVAASVDVNPRFVYLDPYIGTQLAFLESYRNLIAIGADPIALTNCLNFGNPEHEEVMWQFDKATEGLSDIANDMNIPVVSGNVSFYNGSNDSDIYPTPTIGMVGIMQDAHKALSLSFKKPKHSIYMIGEIKEKEIGGSAYIKYIHNLTAGRPPMVNTKIHKLLKKFMLKCVESGLIAAAHDVSKGGIGVTIAEMCISSDLGADIMFRYDKRPDFYIFSETQGVIVIESNNDEKIETIAKLYNIKIQRIGNVGGNRLKINDIIDLDVGILKHKNSIFFKEIFS